MYSEEIHNYLKDRNWRIKYKDIQYIMNCSKQVNLLKYEGSGDEMYSDTGKYYMSTNDGYEWTLYVDNYYVS